MTFNSSDQVGSLDFVRLIELTVQVEKLDCLLWGSNDSCGRLLVEIDEVPFVDSSVLANMERVIQFASELGSSSDSSHDSPSLLVETVWVSSLPDLSSELSASSESSGEVLEHAEVLQFFLLVQVHPSPVVHSSLLAKMELVIETSGNLCSGADTSHDLASHFVEAILVSGLPDLSSELSASANGTSEVLEQAKILEVERSII